MSETKTTEARGAVLTLLDAGWTPERIAVRLRVSESSVRCWRDRGTQPRRDVRARLLAMVAKIGK
jgi:hypothetical protein